MRKKIAVILNGCGHRDGSEIHESVLTLLAIDECGWQWEVLALDADQYGVVNHMDGSAEKQATPRNMLRESARIARGRVRSLEDSDPEGYAAVVIPGGFGAANNLCNFGAAGKDMAVNSVLDKFLRQAHLKRIPIGAICIAPIILAKLFGRFGVNLTLGGLDNPAAIAASAMGARVTACKANACVTDTEARVVTSPAYMLDAPLPEIARGIKVLIQSLAHLADEAKKN